MNSSLPASDKFWFKGDRSHAMPRYYDLPSLTALLGFEAAARHGSFKRAAAELNVTPTAISHQMRQLEGDLGKPLFVRGYRGVELTETGAYLFLALQKGFGGMAEVIRDIRAPQAPGEVTVSVTTAMSAYWLTPLLSDFWRETPQIAIAQRVNDSPQDSEGCQISVRYGTPEPDEPCHILFHDRILALAAPGFAAEHRVRDLADLARLPLIHVVTDNPWIGWTEWLDAMGAPEATGRRITVTSHMIALQLAQDGAGAVLGWDRLISGLQEREQLVPLLATGLSSPMPFHIRLHDQTTPEARQVFDWLAGRAGS